jgi:hypothetical protein
LLSFPSHLSVSTVCICDSEIAPRMHC